MTGVDPAVTVLPRVRPDPGGRPDAADGHPMRAVCRAVAFEAGGWTPERAVEVRELFDRLAPDWDSRASEIRSGVLEDALDRAGPLPAGRWLELGSGTGLLTPVLAERAERAERAGRAGSTRASRVVAIDLSAEMLARAPAGPGARVRGDGSRLPFPDRSLEVVVAFNAFLFPAEVGRVLAAGGALVWANSAGPATPIYLTPGEVVRALDAGAGRGRWRAVASEAGWGEWAVVREAG